MHQNTSVKIDEKKKKQRTLPLLEVSFDDIGVADVYEEFIAGSTILDWSVVSMPFIYK